MWSCMEVVRVTDTPSTSGTQQEGFSQQELDPHVREQAARALFQLSTSYGAQNSGGPAKKTSRPHRPSYPYPNNSQLQHVTSTAPLSGAITEADPTSRSHTCMINDCGKRFSSGDKLNRHALTHTGVKPYACSFCGKAFGRSDHMTKHQRTHTGEKPFECTLCGKRFARTDKLSSHKKIHFK